MMQKFLFNKYFSLFAKRSFSSSTKPAFFEDLIKTIPYNFQGVNINQPSKLKPTVLSFLRSLFDENIEDGFKLAFNSYLDALAERDLEFFQNVLEPSFFNKMKTYDEKLKANSCSIEAIHENSDLNIEITKLVMNIGVKSDRTKKSSTKITDKISSNFVKVMLNKSTGMDIELFLPNIQDFNNSKNTSMPFVLQVFMMITSKKKLILRRNDYSKPEVNAYDDNFKHKLVFECQSFISMQKMMTSVSMISSTTFSKEIMFPKGQTEWILSDFDDFMEGNPF